jgi:hypothetical protein
MGSSNNNIISQLKATMSELKQGFSSMRQEMSGFGSILHAVPGVNNIIGASASNVNRVAPNPVFNSAPGLIGMTESGNIVAAGPSASMTAGSGFTQQSIPGMENLGQYVAKNPGSGTVYTPYSMSVGSSGGLSNLMSNQFLNGDTSKLQTLEGNQTGINSVASTGLGGGASSLVSGLVTMLAKFGLGTSLLPGTDETVQADLLMKRIGFFNGISGVTAGGAASTVAKMGTVTSSLDALNALAAAQSMGLSSSNFDKSSIFNAGVANVSNLTPGMGVEGAMRATGAMQQASSVNMLRGIGIQLRDANGNMAAPDKVIDDVWTKISRDYSQAYGANTSPSLEEVKIALQPGNSLDSMLDQYFGSDPMLKNMVMNGLLYRAQNKGSTLAGGVDTGITSTSAITSLSAKNADTTKLLGTSFSANTFSNSGGTVASGAAGGFTAANNIIKTATDAAISASTLTVAALVGKTFTDTLLSASGGAPADILSALAGILPGKATGGPVQGSTAYLVGERGPELFVPGVSGMIVPNDEIQPNQNKNSGTITGSSNNTYNFNINIPNANTPEVIAALRKLLSDLETNKIVSES